VTPGWAAGRGIAPAVPEPAVSAAPRALCPGCTGMRTSACVEPRRVAGSTGSRHRAESDEADVHPARAAQRGARWGGRRPASARPRPLHARQPARDRRRRPYPAATRLLVDDDGRGVGPADRERASASGHVGLTLLEGLVEQAGGTLSVRSRPGAGTTVASTYRPGRAHGGRRRPRERLRRRARGARGPRRGRRRGRAALSVRRLPRSPRAAAAAGWRARTPAGRCRGSGRRSSAPARAG
jgi:hypothetical protein